MSIDLNEKMRSDLPTLIPANQFYVKGVPYAYLIVGVRYHDGALSLDYVLTRALLSAIGLVDLNTITSDSGLVATDGSAVFVIWGIDPSTVSATYTVSFSSVDWSVSALTEQALCVTITYATK